MLGAVTHHTWGPPPPCKQALKLDKARVWRFWTDSRTSPGYFISIALFNNVFLSVTRVYEKNVKQKQSKTLIGLWLFKYIVEMKYKV